MFILLIAFAGAFMSMAHLVGRRALAVRYTKVQTEMEPDAYGRANAMKLGLEIFATEPMGLGLGGFENAFRLKQAPGSEGRWVEVHNDWLQAAIELGIPGILLLLLAFVAWWLLWWSALHHGPSLAFYIGLPLGLAILVPSFCSLADFQQPVEKPWGC